MNKEQRITLWVGIVLFVLVGLKDPGRLLCYWTMIAVVTGGLLVLLKDEKDKEPKQ